MLVYYTVFIITILLCGIIPAKTDKEYLRKLILVFLPLFLFGALRVDFGIDYTGYELDYYQFHTAGVPDHEAHSEVGYQWIEILMPSWRSLVSLTAFMLCLSWITLCYRYINGNRLILTVCLLFIAGNFTIFTPLVTMRNGMTITCFLVSLPLIIERKYIYALAVAFAAHYIHSSILLFAPIALLVGINKTISRREIIIWTSVFIIFFISGAAGIIDKLTMFINTYFNRYDTVLESMKESEHVSWLAGATNVLLIVGIFSVFYNNRDALSKAENSIFRISFIYLLCPYLGALGGARMQCYFLPLFVVAIVKMYDLQWQSKYVKFGFYCLVFFKFFYAFLYVWQWNNPYFVFQTYKSIFD